MLRVFVMIVCLFVMQVFPAFADAPPVPARKIADTDSLQKQLQQEQEHKSRLESDLKNTEKSLEATKKEMVKTAESVRAHEQLMQSLQQRIEKLANESAAIQEDLEHNYGAVSDLILTLARMRRVPPETLIVRPGAPLQTAQSALLLQGMLQTVRQQAISLSASLQKLAEMKSKLEADRTQAQETQAALDAKYAEIAALAEKRSRLYKSLNSDYRTSVAAVNRIAAQAQNLQEFMARVEQEKTAAENAPAETRSFFSRKLSTRKVPEVLPVSGDIMTSFGDRDNIGAVSQGITIQAQPRALVVAPFSGTIKFAGNFKNYGPVVIIQHDKNYHSLIIGMEKITAATGQDVDAGEPVGRLPAASSRGGSPTLYYELRHKGRPVDPSGKSIDIRS